MLVAEQTPGPNAAGMISRTEKKNKIKIKIKKIV
jgi:hypothetical protein